MKIFSIKHLEHFSDIKAHTIRIWEHRYGIFKPIRTKGNVRIYSLNDLKHLLNIALLIKNGFKISELTAKENNGLIDKIKYLTQERARKEKVVSQLIICMFSHDIEQFDDILDSCVISWGIGITINDVIIPFLEKVQLLSYNDSSCEAHLAVTAIRRKLILGLERASPSVTSNKSALLFLDKGEHYDLILLYISYILKTNGIKVCYLGTNISGDNLQLMLNSKKPDYLFTYIPKKEKFKMQSVISYLDDQLPQTKFFVVAAESKSMHEENLPNVQFIHYKDVEFI